MNVKIGYIMNIDVGTLEDKSILLAESIRRFVEAQPMIIFVKPNKKRLSKHTLEYIQSREIHFHEIELKDFYDSNIMMSKIFIAAYAERIYQKQVDYFIFLDNDTLFLNQIEDSLFDEEFLIGMRPTDFSDGSLQSFVHCTSVWDYLIDKFKIQESKEWIIKTNLDNIDTFASFNSGFILTKANTNFFEKWKEIAVLLNSDCSFLGLIYQDRIAFHFLDQILLSLLIMKDFDRNDVKILDVKYNFSLEPIFFNRMINFQKDKMIFKKMPIEIENIVHLHYHQRFEEISVLRYFKRKDHFELISQFVPFGHSHKSTVKKIVKKSFVTFKFITYVLMHDLHHHRTRTP